MENTGNFYFNYLIETLGDEGKAVVSWLSHHTTNEEFLSQPVNLYQQERLLIDHAVSMHSSIVKLAKVAYSKQVEGQWVFDSPYSLEDYARVALYHILGRINKFKRERRNKKNAEGKWEEVIVWTYNDEKTIYGTDGAEAILVLKDIFAEYGLEPLNREVEIAILNMDGVWENPTKSGMYPQLYKQHPLALLAHLADLMDSYLQ